MFHVAIFPVTHRSQKTSHRTRYSPFGVGDRLQVRSLPQFAACLLEKPGVQGRTPFFPTLSCRLRGASRSRGRPSLRARRHCLPAVVSRFDITVFVLSVSEENNRFRCCHFDRGDGMAASKHQRHKTLFRAARAGSGIQIVEGCERVQPLRIESMWQESRSFSPSRSKPDTAFIHESAFTINLLLGTNDVPGRRGRRQHQSYDEKERDDDWDA